jgi:hypothetical protein
MRRFTRLTNAFSKKLENLKAALAPYFAWYNFVRIHSTLRVPRQQRRQVWPTLFGQFKIWWRTSGIVNTLGRQSR